MSAARLALLRTARLSRNDVRLQWRYGFHAVYVVVTLAYLIALRALPEEGLRWALPFVVYSDPAALGFFLVGGLLLLERADGCLHALGVTPIRWSELIAAKALSLTAICVACTVALVLSSGAAARWPLLLAAVVLTSVFNVLLGVLVVSHCRTINQYFALSIAVSLPLFVPVLGFLWWPESAWCMAFPTTASIRLIAAGLELGSVSAWEASLGFAVLLASSWIVGRWGVRSLARSTEAVG